MSLGGGSAKKAAAAAQKTANQGAGDILATNQANAAMMQPNVQFAQKAMTPLGGLLSLSGYDSAAQDAAVRNDAGYKYGLNEAIRAQDASAAGKGTLFSGQSLLGAADLGNRYYGTARQDAINNFMNLYNTGNGLLGNIAANNNAATGNAANLRYSGAQGYAQQRAQAANNNTALWSGLIGAGANLIGGGGF